MTAAVLSSILERHGIHRRFWHDFRLLVVHGRQPTGELQTRLNHVINYKAALKAALTIPKQFESLDPGDVQMVVDFMGREIAAGNVVAYPVRRGSKMWLNKLNVQHVEDDRITGYNNLGRRITVTNLKNVVVVA